MRPGQLIRNSPRRKKRVIERWLVKARDDSVTAQTMLENDLPVTDTVCFHAQRCAEKKLKAFFTFLDVHVEKTHDLARFLKLCVEHDATWTSLTNAADELNPYAGEVRYADDGRDIPVEEAARAVEMAENIMAFIQSKLGVSAKE